jgi:hypothetical protein
MPAKVEEIHLPTHRTVVEIGTLNTGWLLVAFDPLEAAAKVTFCRA